MAAWEATEEGEREIDPFGDDFVEFMDSLLACQKAAKGETAMALWLVRGWWPGVKTELPGQELPASWRPLFDDVFGDAFQPVTLESAWRTDTVLSLAGRISKSRDFSLMPILVDALRDAGCDSERLLAHCRGPGPHVRGCWVLDLLLERP